jgi:hypothetical protein
VDGSSQEARPVRLCRREVCLERREIKQSLLGVAGGTFQSSHQNTGRIYRHRPVPGGGGAQTKRVREMVGRAHVADIMMDSDTNPTNDLAAIVGECRVAVKPTSDYTTGGVQTRPHETAF